MDIVASKSGDERRKIITKSARPKPKVPMRKVLKGPPDNILQHGGDRRHHVGRGNGGHHG